jgi:hypothetical protein
MVPGCVLLLTSEGGGSIILNQNALRTENVVMTAANLPAPEIWAKTVDTVKHRVNHRSLWEAMEQTVAITIENDTMIIGLSARIFNLAGHLNVSEHRNAIERALSEHAGRPLKLRVIEGETLTDWENTKQREARVAAMREASYERRDREQAAAQSWDTLYDYVARAYSSAPYRQLPQGKARYMSEMLYAISDAMETLYPENADEFIERQLARVIDRVASSADVASTMVALELERLRAWRKQNPS